MKPVTNLLVLCVNALLTLPTNLLLLSLTYIAYQSDTRIIDTANKLVSGIFDINNKLVTSIVDTADKCITQETVIGGVNNTGNKFVRGVDNTGNKIVSGGVDTDQWQSSHLLLALLTLLSTFF